MPIKSITTEHELTCDVCKHSCRTPSLIACAGWLVCTATGANGPFPPRAMVVCPACADALTLTAFACEARGARW